MPAQVDALYFTVMTFTTVGYGDIGPSAPGSRVFTAIFALIGVSLIGSALGIVAGYVIELVEVRMERALAAAKKAGRDQDLEKAQIIADRMKKKKKAVFYNFLYMVRHRRCAVVLVLQLVSVCLSLQTIVIALGTVMFMWHESENDVNFTDAFYGAVITSTSVGYGDVSFSTQLGRGLATIYMMAAVMTMSNFVAGISGYIIDVKQEQLIQKALRKKLRVSDIIEMDDDEDGEVDRLEFLTKMLIRLRKCEKADVDEILEQFDVLDIDNSGTLTMADILKGEEGA
eukprot:SAG31_NODE_6963_length_1833_cov_1.531719_2_plen_285_part_00